MDAYFAGKYKTAFKLLKPAAEAGNALAGYQVGVMYDVGQGVHVNKLAALAWYRIAAESDPRAQVAMAERLMEGRGIAHDQPAAVSWYRKAAAQADLTALLRLAIAYRDGELGHKVLDLVDRQNLSMEIEAHLSPEQSAESKTLQNSWTWPMLDELPSSSKTGAVP
jgi:TPR repeat protein